MMVAGIPIAADEDDEEGRAATTRAADSSSAAPADLADDVGPLPLADADAVHLHAAMMRLDGLPLPPSLFALDSCGFVVASDLDGLGPAELAAELGTTQEQARSLLLEVRGATRGPPKRATSSGFELLEEERRATRVVTFIERLDALLGGGVAATQLTEFSGVPGIGKTQLGMQLAVNVQIPRVMGGAEGEAVYVDTEGSFLAERCYAIATALLAHLQRTAERDENPLHRAALQKLGDVKALLGRIHVFRVHDAHEQLACVRQLDAFVRQRPAVKLLVLDSVAFHPRRRPELRRADADARADGAVAHRARRPPPRRRRADEPGDDARQRRDGERAGAPALGDSWAHACNVQAMLEWRDGERHARLYKGAMSEAVPYVVTADGVPKPKPAVGGEATGVKRPAEWGAERERWGLPPTGYAARTPRPTAERAGREEEEEEGRRRRARTARSTRRRVTCG